MFRRNPYCPLLFVAVTLGPGCTLEPFWGDFEKKNPHGYPKPSENCWGLGVLFF